MKFLGP